MPSEDQNKIELEATISSMTTEQFYALRLLETVTDLDTSTAHGKETPKRFAAMLKEITTGRVEFNFTTFPADGIDEMIVVGPIAFYTMCNHHVIPFFGKCWIGYVPQNKMAGLSKFARTVKYFAKGMWVQEQLTMTIADYLVKQLDNPLGVAVVMKAEHLCMTMRGVESPGTITTTSAMRGVFGDHTRLARSEFMALIREQ